MLHHEEEYLFRNPLDLCPHHAYEAIEQHPSFLYYRLHAEVTIQHYLEHWGSPPELTGFLQGGDFLERKIIQ